MPSLREATAPKNRPTAVATPRPTITASHGDQAASSPPSAATRLAMVKPAIAYRPTWPSDTIPA